MWFLWVPAASLSAARQHSVATAPTVFRLLLNGQRIGRRGASATPDIGRALPAELSGFGRRHLRLPRAIMLLSSVPYRSACRAGLR